MKLCSDTILFSPGADRWVAYNVRGRTAVGIDADGLAVLGEIGGSDEKQFESHFGDRNLSVWKIDRFSNVDGLLADPTRIVQDVAAWPDPECLDLREFLKRLANLSIVIEDEKEYAARFQPKTSLLDYSHFGNFHQQLGQHLMVEARQNPADWWVKQKFAVPGKEIRDNLYSAVQDNFLRSYFADKIKPNMRVLDLGCGPGYFSNMMAQCGADVVGVDPSESYLAIAKTNTGGRVQFEKADIGKEGALKFLPDNEFDLIFMSDALLFYFVPESPTQEADVRWLFSDVRRLLKNEGQFVSVEPHYLFWLAPWLGSAERPFTVFAEYNDPPGMRVTPTLSRLMATFCENGFCIAGMKELFPADWFADNDPRAYAFGRRFPLWQLYELIKRSAK